MNEHKIIQIFNEYGFKSLHTAEEIAAKFDHYLKRSFVQPSLDEFREEMYRFITFDGQDECIRISDRAKFIKKIEMNHKWGEIENWFLQGMSIDYDFQYEMFELVPEVGEQLIARWDISVPEIQKFFIEGLGESSWNEWQLKRAFDSSCVNEQVIQLITKKLYDLYLETEAAESLYKFSEEIDGVLSACYQGRKVYFKSLKQ